jgi:site-specific DNA recombinase
VVTSSKRAGIYTRISVDRAKEDDESRSASPQRQSTDCEALCDRQGFKVVEVYEDRDVSAFKGGVKRPAFERLLQDLRDKKLDVVVVWKFDRITREGIRGTGTFLDALNDGEAFLMTVMDGIDTREAHSEMVMGILASTARGESANTGIRVARAARQAAEEGRPHVGGHRMYGYSYDGTIIEDEADHIRTFARMIQGGTSLRRCAYWANELGWKTTAGNPWQPGSISQTLRSARLRGVREYKGEFFPGKWEPIFTEVEHLTLLKHLSDPSAPNKVRVDRLLTGVIRCGRCGFKMGHGKFLGKDKEFPRYTCKRLPGTEACGRMAVTMESVDALVSREVLAFFRNYNQNQQVGRLDLEERRAELKAEIKDFKKRIDQLADDYYLKRSLPEATYTRIRLDLENDIASAESEISSLDRDPTTQRAMSWADDSNDPEVIWHEQMTTRDQREIVRGVIEKIEVSAAKVRGGNRFDESRITITWKEYED